MAFFRPFERGGVLRPPILSANKRKMRYIHMSNNSPFWATGVVGGSTGVFGRCPLCPP